MEAPSYKGLENSLGAEQKQVSKLGEKESKTGTELRGHKRRRTRGTYPWREEKEPPDPFWNPPGSFKQEWDTITLCSSNRAGTVEERQQGDDGAIRKVSDFG